MSGDPKRLLVDPDTSDAVRHDLERALEAPPPPYDVSKGLSRLLAITVPAAAAGLGAGAVAKGAKWAVLLKWGLGGSAVLATAVVATTVIVSPSAPDASGTGQRLTEAPPARVAPPAAPAPAPVAAVDSPAPEVSAPVVESPPPSAPSAGNSRSRSRAPASETAAADNRVSREVALLGRARSALSSNPAQALALAEEGQRDFPRGVLREERESIAVLALVRLNRDGEAKARGKAFLERYPNGPFSEKVRAAMNR